MKLKHRKEMPSVEAAEAAVKTAEAAAKTAKQEAKLAKATFKHARKAAREAKKAASKARKELRRARKHVKKGGAKAAKSAGRRKAESDSKAEPTGKRPAGQSLPTEVPATQADVASGHAAPAAPSSQDPFAEIAGRSPIQQPV